MNIGVDKDEFYPFYFFFTEESVGYRRCEKRVDVSEEFVAKAKAVMKDLIEIQRELRDLYEEQT